MYSTCLFCNKSLGRNEVLPQFPVGRRLAFDPQRGRLWVICGSCHRWNLTPLEERWEAVEECERQFRAEPVRFSTDNIGLAFLRAGLDLVRIGKAPRSEIAVWRYGHYLRQMVTRSASDSAMRLLRDGARLAGRAADAALVALGEHRGGYDAVTWLRIHRQRRRVIDITTTADGDRAVIRFEHLERAELIRPDRGEPWRLTVPHDDGRTTLAGESGVRTAGKLFAAINGRAGSPEEVRWAVSKIDDAGDPDGYFNKVAALAMRTSWGRNPDAVEDGTSVARGGSVAEQLALYLTNRSFWGRGAVGSEPSTLLPRLPLVDRIALEMAANEDAEHRAMQGELAELEAAWRDAEEIAEIADNLLSERAAERAALGKLIGRMAERLAFS